MKINYKVKTLLYYSLRHIDSKEEIVQVGPLTDKKEVFIASFFYEVNSKESHYKRTDSL